jgi:pimeloyl-ACP methyl ester carboxylesterase
VGRRARDGLTVVATAPAPGTPAVALDEARPAPRAWTAIGPREAPTLVFIHGTRLTRAQWWPQTRRLADAFRCVAVDLPGHGALAGQPFSIAAAVAIVREAIRAEAGSGRATLVGLSLGGYLAIDVAEAHPELVDGLVLAGCSSEAIGAAAAPHRFFRWLLRRAPGRAQDAVNRAFFRVRYGAAIAQPIVDGGFWPEGGAAALDALIGRRYLDRLGRLWTPVTVVNGAFDPVFGPQGEYWAASCRRGRHVVVQRAMHLSNLDRPATFSRVVAAFARQVAGTG